MFGKLTPEEIENVLTHEIIGHLGCHADDIVKHSIILFVICHQDEIQVVI